ncbi:hypothetical protein D4R30_00165 [archaeon]|nr:MAG: hypothetical protein D4R30_00165 [archaeon]
MPYTTYTTRALAHHIGCSAKFLRSEIADGHLKATRIGTGHAVGSRFRITHTNANRYCKRLGFPRLGQYPPAIEALWTAMSTSTVAAVLATKGIIRAANRAMAAVSGFPLSQVIGRHLFTFAEVPIEFDLHPVFTHAEHVVLKHKSGVKKPVHVTRIPLVIDEELFLFVIGSIEPKRTKRHDPLARSKCACHSVIRSKRTLAARPPPHNLQH